MKGTATNGHCKVDEDTGAEDVEMGLCLQSVNVEAGDSRDVLGRGRFFPYVPEQHLFPDLIPIGHIPEYPYYPLSNVSTHTMNRTTI